MPASPPSLPGYPGPGWFSPTVNSFLVCQPALNIIRLLLDLTVGTPRNSLSYVVSGPTPADAQYPSSRSITLWLCLILWSVAVGKYTLLYFTLLYSSGSATVVPSWIRHWSLLVDPTLCSPSGSTTVVPSWIRHCGSLVDPPLWLPRGSATMAPSWIHHCGPLADPQLWFLRRSATVVPSWIRHCGPLVDSPLLAPSWIRSYPLPPRWNQSICLQVLHHSVNSLRKNCSCVNIMIKSLYYPCFKSATTWRKKMTPHW